MSSKVRLWYCGTMSELNITAWTTLSALAPIPPRFQWHWWAGTTTLIWSYHVTSILFN